MRRPDLPAMGTPRSIRQTASSFIAGKPVPTGNALTTGNALNQAVSRNAGLERIHLQRWTTPGSTQSISYSRLAASSEVLPVVS